jgi:hypothetical protein
MFVLDGVRVVRTGSFKNLLEVLFGWSGVPPEIVLSRRHELLVGVLDLIPEVAVVRHRGEMTWVALLPILPTLRALLGASDSDIGGCGLATTGGHTHFSQSEGGPDSLLTQGMSGCDVELLLGGFMVARGVNQRVARSAIPEGRYNVGVGHTRELMTLL